MKKNTLLYLEKNLVEKAKKSNINISTIAEDALREALNEHRDRTDPSYIYENLNKTFLPYRIKKITIKDYAMFKNASFSFKDTNLITGMNASGKTLLLKALQGKVGSNGDIAVEISSKTKKTTKDFMECVLIDNAFSRLDKGQPQKLLKWIKTKLKGKQLIITSRTEMKGFENMIKLRPSRDSSGEIHYLVGKKNALQCKLNELHCMLSTLKSKNKGKKSKELTEKIKMIEKEISCVQDEICCMEERITHQKVK